MRRLGLIAYPILFVLAAAYLVRKGNLTLNKVNYEEIPINIILFFQSVIWFGLALYLFLVLLILMPKLSDQKLKKKVKALEEEVEHLRTQIETET